MESNDVETQFPIVDLNQQLAQMQLISFAHELFGRRAAATNQPQVGPYQASLLPDGGVVLAEARRGGGRIFVAPDRSALWVGSGVGYEDAFSAYRDGARTPIEEFGAEG
jgi:hypothetical protein